MIDRIERFAARHERAIALLAGLWFWLNVAHTARFVDLPDIPFVTDRNALWLSAAFNAGWWGFLRPAIERRRVERMAEEAAVVPPIDQP